MARRKKQAVKSAIMDFDITKKSSKKIQPQAYKSESKAVIYCRVSDVSQVKN